MTMRDDYLEKIEGTDREAQEKALTDLWQTHLGEYRDWGPKDG